MVRPRLWQSLIHFAACSSIIRFTNLRSDNCCFLIELMEDYRRQTIKPKCFTPGWASAFMQSVSMIFHPPSVLRLQDKRIKLEHQSFWILGWDYKRQKTAQILSPQLPCFWRKRDFTRDHLQDLLRPRLCQWNSFGPTNHFEILIPSKIYSLLLFLFHQ